MEENEKKSNSLFKVVIILGILLAAAVVAIILTTTTMSKKVNEATLANEQLQLTNEQLQLANEYQALNTEYAQYENQSQLLANDSLVSKYAAAKSKVEKLLQELNSERKSAQRIKQLQDEIGTLKNILRHYVTQIDSLGKENEAIARRGGRGAPAESAAFQPCGQRDTPQRGAVGAHDSRREIECDRCKPRGVEEKRQGGEKCNQGKAASGDIHHPAEQFHSSGREDHISPHNQS